MKVKGYSKGLQARGEDKQGVEGHRQRESAVRQARVGGDLLGQRLISAVRLQVKVVHATLGRGVPAGSRIVAHDRECSMWSQRMHREYWSGFQPCMAEHASTCIQQEAGY